MNWKSSGRNSKEPKTLNSGSTTQFDTTFSYVPVNVLASVTLFCCSENPCNYSNGTANGLPFLSSLCRGFEHNFNPAFFTPIKMHIGIGTLIQRQLV